MVLHLVVGGAEVAESRMPAPRIVETLDVPREPQPGLFAGGEAFTPQEFLLEAREERLGNGVVPRVSDESVRQDGPG